MPLSARTPAWVAALALTLGAAAPAAAQEAQPIGGKPIDLVLCLDVSGSMNGLVDSAKIKLSSLVGR